MKVILSWLEVWAFLIPIFFLPSIKQNRKYLTPVKIYIVLAFVLNLAGNIISNQKKFGYNLPWHNNVALYNLHSIIRLVLFSCFFLMLKQQFIRTIKLLLPVGFLIFVIINFTFIEPFYKEKISTNVHLAETLILLFLSFQYYIYVLKGEQSFFTKDPSFWIVTGLCIFVVSSFVVYLFYDSTFYNNWFATTMIWQIQKLALLIFCVFIAKAFYVSR